ncbi:MAG: T9SS type A sorting domain-containing protein [Sphingobacteriaceae bacterium]|nr:T9SS type A sorting domain-containing protein [Sphingobacteriaceae bacterium]
MKIKITGLAFLFCIQLLAQLPAYIPTSSLVAWYPFDGNTLDMSGNGNHCAAFNGPTLKPDRFNNAASSFSLDGVNDYINSTLNFFNSSEPHTISMWWKTGDYTKASQTFYSINPFFQEGVLFNHAPNGSNQKITYMLGTGAGTFDINNSSVGFTVVPNFTTWHHLLVIRTNTEWRFYSDGVLSHTFTSAPTGTLIANMRFGAENNGVFGGGKNFKGQLDDIAIWNRVLDSCEIWKVYNASAGNITPSSSSSLICTGETATLNVSGATSYTWNPGNIISNSLVISPTVSSTYSVSSHDSISTCTSFTTFTQEVALCTNLQSNSFSENEILVYPNPGSGKFTVVFDQKSEIRIMDLSGKIIFEEKVEVTNSNHTNVEIKNAGIFWLEVKTPNKILCKKIIVIQ